MKQEGISPEELLEKLRTMENQQSNNIKDLLKDLSDKPDLYYIIELLKLYIDNKFNILTIEQIRSDLDINKINKSSTELQRKLQPVIEYMKEQERNPLVR